MNTNVRTKPQLREVSADRCEIPCFNAPLVRALKAKQPSENALDDARLLFSSLSDPTRLKFVLALREGKELCVCDLAHVAETSISTASHHLRKLRDLGILKYRNDGRMAYYALRNKAVGKLADSACFPQGRQS